MYPHFANAVADRVAITKIPVLGRFYPGQDACFSLQIRKITKPFIKHSVPDQSKHA